MVDEQAGSGTRENVILVHWHDLGRLAALSHDALALAGAGDAVVRRLPAHPRVDALLAAAEGERGVFRYEGRMVDEPVLRHARSVLARA